MRAVLIGVALVFVSHSAFAQQAAQPSLSSSPGAPAARTMVSSADVAALVARAKADRKEGQPVNGRISKHVQRVGNQPRRLGNQASTHFGEKHCTIDAEQYF